MGFPLLVGQKPFPRDTRPQVTSLLCHTFDKVHEDWRKCGDSKSRRVERRRLCAILLLRRNKFLERVSLTGGFFFSEALLDLFTVAAISTVSDFDCHLFPNAVVPLLRSESMGDLMEDCTLHKDWVVAQREHRLQRNYFVPPVAVTSKIEFLARLHPLEFVIVQPVVPHERQRHFLRFFEGHVFEFTTLYKPERRSLRVIPLIGKLTNMEPVTDSPCSKSTRAVSFSLFRRTILIMSMNSTHRGLLRCQYLLYHTVN